MGSVTLDLRGATFAERDITITANAIMGEVKVIVDAGTNVVVSGVPIMGEFHQAKDKVAPALGPDSPIVRVKGMALMGSVTSSGCPAGTPKKILGTYERTSAMRTSRSDCHETGAAHGHVRYRDAGGRSSTRRGVTCTSVTVSGRIRGIQNPRVASTPPLTGRPAGRAGLERARPTCWSPGRRPGPPTSASRAAAGSSPGTRTWTPRLWADSSSCTCATSASATRRRRRRRAAAPPGRWTRAGPPGRSAAAGGTA